MRCRSLRWPRALRCRVNCKITPSPRLQRGILYPETSERREEMVLSLTTRTCEPDITVIEIGGRITLGRESGQIEAAVLKALNEGVRKLVLDLGQVTYIDSTGIGIIAYCFGKISKSGAQASVAGAKGLVMEVFKITRLDSVIKFFPDSTSACNSFAAASPSA
jgi:anti-sigma B factor antagonist